MNNFKKQIRREKSNRARRIIQDYLEKASSYLHGPELAAKAKVSEATVRTVVATMRKEGYPVISDDNGYRLAKYKEDLNETIEHLLSRVRSLKEIIECLRATQQGLPSQDLQVKTVPEKKISNLCEEILPILGEELFNEIFGG